MTVYLLLNTLIQSLHEYEDEQDVSVFPVSELRDIIGKASAGYTVAVDFDGVLCREKYPDIGEERKFMVQKVRLMQKFGIKTILWTCRTGKHLEDAVAWCKQHGLSFDAVNENLPVHIEKYGNDCRKVFADEYWDDKAMRVENFTNPATIMMPKLTHQIDPHAGCHWSFIG